MQTFDAFEGLTTEEGHKVACPIILGDNYFPILRPNQLSKINCGRLIHHLCNVCKAPYFGSAKALFYRAKTPIGAEFSVSHQHEGYLYPVIESDQNTPCKVLHHKSIFVLAGTIVCMEDKVPFTQIVMGEKVVKERYGTISTFADADPLIDEVIDLCKNCSSNIVFFLMQHTCRGMASQQIHTSSA